MKIRLVVASSALLLAMASCSADTGGAGTAASGTSSVAAPSVASSAGATTESSESSSSAVAPATTVSSASSESVAASPTEVVEPESIGKLAAAVAEYKGDAAKYAVPGSPAFVYAEGSDLLGQAGAAAGPNDKAIKFEDGWKLAGSAGAAIVLTDFVVDPTSGLVTTFKRNGVSLNNTVAAGDGQEYVATPSEFDDWTGSVTGKVHSFRYFDGSIRMIVITKNDSTVKAEFRFDEYAADGKQYTQIYSDETLPGLTRASIQLFDQAPGGGKAYGHVWVGGSGAEEPVVDVPALG